MHHRIIITEPTDYVWPFVAILQEWDENDAPAAWIELDARGGDTPEEAIDELREYSALARRAPVERQA